MFGKSDFELALEKVGNNQETFVEIDESQYEEEIKLIEDLNEKSVNNWTDYRDPSNFNLVVREYSFGKRETFDISPEHNYYYQLSRAGKFSNIQAMVNRFINCGKNIDAQDELRIAELLEIYSRVNGIFDDFLTKAKTDEDKQALITAFKSPGTKFVELGFKEPRLLSYYKETKNGLLPSYSGVEYVQEYTDFVGYDLSPISTGVASKLGWDARTIDLNSAEEIDLENAGMVVAYHLLDKLSNPYKTLQMLSNNSALGTKFHFEVPVEDGTPRLRYSKLSAFHKEDLQNMLLETGFIPVSFSNIPAANGPSVERILAISKGKSD
tara:strand:+ start:447 stop:1418 length:972 start_codon:yes stop_codon:yes gene_type:complete